MKKKNHNREIFSSSYDGFKSAILKLLVKVLLLIGFADKNMNYS